MNPFTEANVPTLAIWLSHMYSYVLFYVSDHAVLSSHLYT